MKYYISDLHFFHKNVTKEGNDFDNRGYESVEEMHQDIKERWNKKITNGDTVYILGDVSLCGTAEELIALVAQLKGHKVLVRGNHDDVSDYRYVQLFDEICDYKEVTDRLGNDTVHLVLSHYPILMWKNQHRGTIHLYGHLHNTEEETLYQNCLKWLDATDTGRRKAGEALMRAYNVGCMMPYMGCEPRTIEEIVRQNNNQAQPN